MDATVVEDTEWDETSPKSKLSFYVDFYLAHGPYELKKAIRTIINTEPADLDFHKTKKCFIPICDKCMAYDVKRYMEKFSHLQWRTGLYTEKDLEEFYEKVEFYAKKRLNSQINAHWPSDP